MTDMQRTRWFLLRWSATVTVVLVVGLAVGDLGSQPNSGW